MNKRGIELAINMLVVIIISLVLLAGGIVLLNKFIGGAEELQAVLDERTEEQLQSLLIDEGQLVALSRQTITFKGTGQGIVGVGILNVGDDPVTLHLEVTPRPIDGRQIPPTITLLYNNQPFTLQQQETHTEPILIKVSGNVPRGTYGFDVQVLKSDGDEYQPKKPIYVMVE